MELAIQNAFVAAAIKQRSALAEGGWGHAVWCNFQTLEGSGYGSCNCGVADLQKALELHEQSERDHHKCPIFKEECDSCGCTRFNIDLKPLTLISFDGQYTYTTRYCKNSVYCSEKAHKDAESAMQKYADVTPA